MIERVIAWSIRWRWLVIGLAGLFALAGVAALVTTPIDAIPDLSETQVIVYAAWPGHAPDELDARVTRTLAKRLREVPGVRTIRTSSEFGDAWIHAIFDEQADIVAARQRVQQQLAQLGNLNLPPGVVPRLAPEAPATGQVFWYTVEGGGLDLGELRELHDARIKPRLAEVEGVAEVASVGGFPVEYRVAIDPRRTTDLKSEIANLKSQISNLKSVIPNPQFTLAPGPRRGIFEKDGNEVVGGVVMMRYGENPVAVIRRLRARITEVQPVLPAGVRIVTGYDRTTLVQAAVSTVGVALLEAIVTATILVLLVLRHFRASLVISLSLPLAVLGSFLGLAALRAAGVLSVETNIMSLAGLVISIGVLVDASAVMAENVMHQLQRSFSNEPVVGDVRDIVLPACQSVGRPIFFSVVIMLLSFLPVFALGGLEGKMFRPLAMTKSLALVTVAGLTITLVPALCTLLIRGRLQAERDNWLVRGLIEAYRPLLNWLLDRPAAIVWIVGATLMLGAAPLGNRPLQLAEWLAPLGPLAQRPLVLMAFVATSLTIAVLGQQKGVGTFYPIRPKWFFAQKTLAPFFSIAGLVIVALIADRCITPLTSEFLTPLDEQTVMDMPITVPGIPIWQAIDDLKARNMVLCRFPEVDMVMGKVGRADTPTDPAPIDMIETMISFRPPTHWPRRHIAADDARAAVELVVAHLKSEFSDPGLQISELIDAILPRFDALMREYCYQRNQELFLAHTGSPPGAAAFRIHVRSVDGELSERARSTFARLAVEETLARVPIQDAQLRGEFARLREFRLKSAAKVTARASHHGGSTASDFDPLPTIDRLHSELSEQLAARLPLSRIRREELIGFGGELDRAVQMPGWTNVWTMPIQNRVDMLATGVNTTIGIRVLGDELNQVVTTSERLAELLRTLPGASDVVADPVRGRPLVQIKLDAARMAAAGVNPEDAALVVDAAQGGHILGTIKHDGIERNVRLTWIDSARSDLDAIRRLPVPLSLGLAPEVHPPVLYSPEQAQKLLNHSDKPKGETITTLAQIADVRFAPGPAAVKGENGRLRNYVRLNVRDRDPLEFVAGAKRLVREKLSLPTGVALEWTGQFEHQQRARRTLLIVLPVVVAVIFAVLWWTYRDLADAVLMLLVVPGAAAGGLFFQWLFGFKFSVNVWIGYIACFGMATSTGIIMLVYLRDAVDRAGGLARMSLDEVRGAVIEGAVHRLRPKLLTEATTILSLAPMLWATGVGSEVIRPMAAPVLGGILIADEVIDLFLPVMFYWVRVRRWRALHREGGRLKSEN